MLTPRRRTLLAGLAAPLFASSARAIEGPAKVPVETRAPELASDKPAFPGQTRAPYKATAPFDMTTVTSELKQPWALQFLSGGRMLVTEKPGTLRIVSADGKLSDPVKGVPAVRVGRVAGETVIADVGALIVMSIRTVPRSLSSSQMVSLPPPTGVLPLCA